MMLSRNEAVSLTDENLRAYYSNKTKFESVCEENEKE
jgi:hypothetical protein